MSKVNIIHISDIHYEKNEPENQGLVLTSFFNDLEIKIDKTNIENTYCIISGDLVNKGNSEKIFEDFYNNFIIKLTKYVPLKNIYCSPGNHDLKNMMK
jgi:predicted MPP superfamily phosphohydrolase